MSDDEYREAVEAMAGPLDSPPEIGIESLVRRLLRRAGRPRKWASDAERKKAAREAKKEAGSGTRPE